MRASQVRDSCLTIAKLLSSILPVAIVCITIPSYGQFRGNFDLQATHSTNVEGTDSASPDNIIQPLLQLRYAFHVEEINLSLLGRYQPNYFLREKDRSFHYGYIGLTASTIFSDRDKTIHSSASTYIQDLNIVHVAHLLDSISLHAKRNLTPSKAMSISSTVLTLKDLLFEEGYSVTMKEVIVEEVESILNDSENQNSKQTSDILNKLLAELNTINASEDQLYLGRSSLSHRGEESISTPAWEFSSAMLIIPSDIGYSGISHNNLYVREDLISFNRRIYSPQLSLTIESELQQNTKTYNNFSYNTLKIHPNFTTTISDVPLGFHYYYSNVDYPNDTLYRYNEQRLWSDIRLEITQGLVSIWSIGIGFRHSPYPLQIHIQTLPPNPLKIDLVAQSKFTQLSFGTGLVYSADEQISLGFFVKFTSNPNTDSLALSASSNQANKFAGPLSTNSYAYDKYGGSILLQTRLLLDVDFGLTVDYEHRRYPTFKIVRSNDRKETVISNTRTDNMYYASGTFAKPFYFGSNRAIGLFTGITPIIDLTYTKLSSSIITFSYHDFTATLNVSLDF